MGKAIDLTGQKFGRWTVIRRSFPNGNKKQPKWLCKCECGTEKTIIGQSLRVGTSRSCGCLNSEATSKRNRLEYGLAIKRRIFGNYKRMAKKRGINFELNFKYFIELTQKDCKYCGRKQNNIRMEKKTNDIFLYNGIDRIDNTKGYIIGNVVPCCKICNYAKHNLTLQEFKDWVGKIYNNIFIKGGGKLKCQ